MYRKEYKEQEIILDMNKKGFINPIDLIAGLIIIIAGFITIFGMVNFGIVLAGIGVLIEGIKIMIQQGL